VTPGLPPARVNVSFDTIGQVIYRSAGSVHLPTKLIWVQGLTDSSQELNDTTATFAMALCAPFDPGEDGTYTVMYNDIAIFDTAGGPLNIPSTITSDPLVIQQISLALLGMAIYPGTEAQLPDALILADRGAAVTPAFRGMRYITIPDWPLAIPFNNISFIFTRNSAGIQGQQSSTYVTCGLGFTPPATAPFCTGDTCCFTRATEDGFAWVDLGAHHFFPGGFIECGMFGYAGPGVSQPVHLMAGSAFPDSSNFGNSFEPEGPHDDPEDVDRVLYGHMEYSYDKINWYFARCNPSPSLYIYPNHSSFSHGYSQFQALSYNSVTRVFYAYLSLLWYRSNFNDFTPGRPVSNVYPDGTGGLGYESTDGINWVATTTFTQPAQVDAFINQGDNVQWAQDLMGAQGTDRRTGRTIRIEPVTIPDTFFFVPPQWNHTYKTTQVVKVTDVVTGFSFTINPSTNEINPTVSEANSFAAMHVAEVNGTFIVGGGSAFTFGQSWIAASGDGGRTWNTVVNDTVTAAAFGVTTALSAKVGNRFMVDYQYSNRY
jgi:hypothetical protein